MTYTAAIAAAYADDDSRPLHLSFRRRYFAIIDAIYEHISHAYY